MDDLSPTEVEALTKVMGSTVLSEYKQREISDVPPTEAQGETTHPYTSETTTATRAQFMQLDQTNATQNQSLSIQELESLQNIKLHVEIILGKTKMPLKDVLKLHSGSVIALEQLAGEPVDLVANGKTIAKAEVVVIDDRFALRILEII